MLPPRHRQRRRSPVRPQLSAGAAARRRDDDDRPRCSRRAGCSSRGLGARQLSCREAALCSEPFMRARQRRRRNAGAAARNDGAPRDFPVRGRRLAHLRRVKGLISSRHTSGAACDAPVCACCASPARGRRRWPAAALSRPRRAPPRAPQRLRTPYASRCQGALRRPRPRRPARVPATARQSRRAATAPAPRSAGGVSSPSRASPRLVSAAPCPPPSRPRRTPAAPRWRR